MFYACGATLLGAVLFVAIRLHTSSQGRYLRAVESAYDLSLQKRRLLRRLAAASELPDTSSLLLVPTLFDQAVERLDPDVDELVAVEALRRSVFGSSRTT